MAVGNDHQQQERKVKFTAWITPGQAQAIRRFLESGEPLPSEPGSGRLTTEEVAARTGVAKPERHRQAGKTKFTAWVTPEQKRIIGRFLHRPHRPLRGG